jgi:hypothetical protein
MCMYLLIYKYTYKTTKLLILYADNDHRYLKVSKYSFTMLLRMNLQ